MRQRGRSAGELLTAFTELDPASVASDALGVTSRVGDFPDGGLGDGDRIRWDAAPRHGWRRPGLGWSPVDAPARLPVFRATAAQVGGLFPLLAAGGVPAVGARLGCDASSGSAFYVHPTEWVLRQLVTNPNMMIFGEPGRGKSSTVVALVLRLMLYGVRTLISGDRKGEYTPVLRALGAEPIALGAGSPRRLNALDLGPLRVRWSTWSHDRRLRELKVVLARWNRLLLALAQAQGYAPTVTDEYVLHLVLRRLIGADDTTSGLRPVTIPQVTRLLADPDDALWAETRFATRRAFLDTLRPITDALSNLVTGPLAGLFDEETNFDLDWDAPIQSMDLSRLEPLGDTAINVALTCLGMWSAMITDLQEDGDLRIVVRDEVWRQMGLGLRAVQAINADLRLSRKDRTIQLLIMHKPSDLRAVGPAGSHEAAIAADLLALCSTRILLGQSTRVADDLADDLALTPTEQDAVTGWAMQRRGRAVWKLENQPGMRIQTVLSATEKTIFDTNAAIRDRPTTSTRSTGDDGHDE